MLERRQKMEQVERKLNPEPISLLSPYVASMVQDRWLLNREIGRMHHEGSVLVLRAALPQHVGGERHR